MLFPRTKKPRRLRQLSRQMLGRDKGNALFMPRKQPAFTSADLGGVVGGWYAIASGSGTLPVSAATRSEYFNGVGTGITSRSRNTCVRQTGYIKQMQLNCVANAGVTELRLRIWQNDSATFANEVYSLRTESENVASQVTGTGTLTISFTTPVYAVRGDMVSLVMNATSNNRFNGVSLAGYGCRDRTGAGLDDTTNVDWNAENQRFGGYIATRFYMDPPDIVLFGDSWASGTENGGTGYTGHCAQVNGAADNKGSDYTHTIAYYIEQLTGLTVQITGIHGNSIESTNSDQIRQRHNQDVVLVKPKVAIYIMGGNDFNAADTYTNATYLTHMTTMLDAAAAAGIVPVLVRLGPYSDTATFTMAKMIEMDTTWTHMQALACKYGGYCIDLHPLLGTFRDGANITGATNANPIVITSAGHGLATGNIVTIASVGGNTAANGTWTITRIDANTFSVPTAGNGVYTSGGTWDVYGNLYNMQTAYNSGDGLHPSLAAKEQIARAIIAALR